MAAQQRYEFGKNKKRNVVYVVQSLELFTNINKTRRQNRYQNFYICLRSLGYSALCIMFPSFTSIRMQNIIPYDILSNRRPLGRPKRYRHLTTSIHLLSLSSPEALLKCAATFIIMRARKRNYRRIWIGKYAVGFVAYTTYY